MHLAWCLSDCVFVFNVGHNYMSPIRSLNFNDGNRFRFFKPTQFLYHLKYPEKSMECYIYNIPPHKVELNCSSSLSVIYSFCKMNAGHIQRTFLIGCMQHLVQIEGSNFSQHNRCDHLIMQTICSFFWVEYVMHWQRRGQMDREWWLRIWKCWSPL